MGFGLVTRHHKQTRTQHALLAALGHWDEVAMHVRASANTGASPDDIREAMLHVAIYAGVPAANHALKIIKETYAEMGVDT